MPKVYNLKKGKDKIPQGAVYVGRPSKYGNPFVVGKDGTRQEVIEKYREYVEDRLAEDSGWCEPLRGKDLICFCAPLPCHADVLLEYANKEKV